MHWLGEAVRFALRHWPLSIVIAVLLYVILRPQVLERRFVYYPYREIGDTPARLGLGFEDVLLKTEDDVRLHGWYLPCKNATRTLLIFHGNAGNISHRVDWLGMLHRLGVHLLIIDYRGYGRSEGKPFENGLYRDASAAYRWWLQNHSPGGEKLVLVGESLGGAVAVDLAARVPVDGLILQSTFTSAWDMAKTIIPLGLIQPLLGFHFDSAQKIRNISCPKLFIHGTRDDIVPLRLGLKLYDAAMAPKLFCEIEGAGHNDLVFIGGSAYLDSIASFLKSIGDGEGK